MHHKGLTRYLRRQGVRALPGLLHRLPEPWGRGLCAAVGACAHRVVSRDRYLARDNLVRVHGDWEPDRIRRFARRVFVEIGCNAYDFLRYPHLSDDEQRALVQFEGREILEGLAGRGAVVVTGHLGCWELLAAGLAKEGYPLKALARPLREERLEALLAEHRRRMGVETVSSRVLPIQCVRHLKQGGLLGVLVDQRIKRGGVDVVFLGQSTRMTDAPARATGVPLVPVGIARQPDGTHRAWILPPEYARGRGIPELTQVLASRLETLIARAPEQWIWIHPRWEDTPRARRPALSADAEEGEAWASG
jgi:KDO2-lipid IV(A) lauroyltransferase